MRFNRTIAFLLLAVGLGTLAGLVGYLSLASVTSQAASGEGVEFVPVVVPAGDVSFGTRLESTMLRVVRYPKESVPAGIYASMDSVAGQVTKVFLNAREPITSTKLSARGGGLSMLIRPQYRATSIEVNQVSGVSGFVLPGDRVDVLLTVRRPGPTPDAVTRTILQNVEVLAAGQKTDQQQNKPVTTQAVTVLVDPRGAEAIALAQNEGELHLVLRNPEDIATTEVAPLSLREILGQTPAGTDRPARRIPAPAAAAATPPPPVRPGEKAMVRVIREAKVSETPAPRDSL